MKKSAARFSRIFVPHALLYIMGFEKTVQRIFHWNRSRDLRRALISAHCLFKLCGGRRAPRHEGFGG
jgi:hypothetical protein